MTGIGNMLLFAQTDANAAPTSWAMPPLGTHWWITIGVAVGLLAAMLAFAYTTRAGIIARTTTKEAIRQPVFLLLLLIAMLMLVILTFVPYFTFGEDVKMLKDCGLATILFAGLLLAVWTSSTSIADEIEGKTAMTLLSKPINRRQFVVGKYFGILQAVLLLLVPLSLCFLALIFYKVGYDARESAAEAPALEQRWIAMGQIIPGVVLIFFETTVLAALSVAISTRLPMVVNMVACFTIFVIGHLTPVLVGTGVLRIPQVEFMAKLIATVLPSLEAFNSQIAVAKDAVVPPHYLALSGLYCAAFSTAAILLAFILFEDRDLA
jgi:ABC-type transport system involved in multi-copper enzyme maturation permease subunit